jgi:hypothetical protein
MVKRPAPQRRSGPPTKKQKAQRTQFGPVSAITTAPVAIGNSLRGSKPVVSVTADGCRIQGRDFAFQAGATAAAVTDWTLIGGLPLTPSVMPATALKAYAQMYGYFRFNAVAVHYITSSATSQTGDIMFYYERDRAGPAIDSTSSSFLPFVLSDANTVLGPQWMNHTAMVRPDPEFKSTNYGVAEDLNEEANGTVFLYSKTSSVSSPGYVIIDYDITFKQLQANPRAGLLPVTRGQWSPVCFRQIAALVANNPVTMSLAGNQVSGAPAVFPVGVLAGDIYKVIFDFTNSQLVNAAWAGVTPANLFAIPYNGAAVSQPGDDGFTAYALFNGSIFNFFLKLTEAEVYAGGNAAGTLTWNTAAAAPNLNLCAEISLVSNVNARMQNSY